MYSCRIPATLRAPAAFILAVLLAFLPAACYGALQPMFIKGTVLNAATGAAIPTAAIITTSGHSFLMQNGLFNERLPPNPYDLLASAPGYRSNMATCVFAGPGQTATVTIRLAPASTRQGTLRGRVTAAGTTSGGLSGALVFTDLGAIAVTDDNGYFTAIGPSGMATVTVAALGYSCKIVKNVDIPALGLRGIAVRLNKITRGLTGPVSGAVRDACTGQQIEGITLSSSNGKVLQTTDSIYRISTPPGTTALLACGEGYQCGLQTLTRFFFPLTAVVNFSLASLERGIGTVSGIITNAETGEGVAAARIATDTQDITFSNSAGEYSLLANPCAKHLMITGKGFQPYAADIIVAAGGVADLNAALAPLTSCMVSGTVKNIFTGLPVAGAQIFAQGTDTAVSDESGAYSLGLSSCSSIISVCADGFFKTRSLVSSSTGAAVIALDFSLIPCLFCRCANAATAATPMSEPQYQ